MAFSNLVFKTDFYVARTPFVSSQGRTLSTESDQPTRGSNQGSFSRMQNQCILKEHPRLSKQVTDVIAASWRSSTQKQYSSYITQWKDFCRVRNENCHKTSITLVLEFLYSLHAKGLGYSAINTARSAISSVLYSRSLKTDVGSHKLVCRFIKGLFVLKPSLPRYSHIWDPEKVLSYMSRFRCSRAFASNSAPERIWRTRADLGL